MSLLNSLDNVGDYYALEQQPTGATPTRLLGDLMAATVPPDARELATYRRDVWRDADEHGNAVDLWADHAAHGLTLVAVYDEGWGLIGHACDSSVELVVFRDGNGRHLLAYATGRPRDGEHGPVLDCTVDELLPIRDAAHWRELAGEYVEYHGQTGDKAGWRLALVAADEIARVIGGPDAPLGFDPTGPIEEALLPEPSVQVGEVPHPQRRHLSANGRALEERRAAISQERMQQARRMPPPWASGQAGWPGAGRGPVGQPWIVVLGCGEAAQAFGPFDDEDTARRALRFDPDIASALLADRQLPTLVLPVRPAEA